MTIKKNAKSIKKAPQTHITVQKEGFLIKK